MSCACSTCELRALYTELNAATGALLAAIAASREIAAAVRAAGGRIAIFGEQAAEVGEQAAEVGEQAESTCTIILPTPVRKIAIHRDTYGDKIVSENDIIFCNPK
ncbi:MAG: hypothetical protein EBU46_17865 [Nitrosomonadaceae bacterium]|nr:hypothetical protein [Nitrosomonadaceae bacterium]